ncbi:MAG TPA: hypothetical protein VJP88_06435 [Caulobacteraceae bacterium]|nr:hypothetical protein [Caulobacteraceae bacterium]
MKLKSVLLGLAAAAVSTGMAFAQMQPIPNPPEKPKAAGPKHHAKKHHPAKHATRKKEATASSTASSTPATASGSGK